MIIWWALAILSQAAFAEDVQLMYDFMVYDDQYDVSLKYLNQIFGQVVNMQGNGTGMNVLIPPLMAIVNTGIVSVALLFSGFIATQAVFLSATDSKAMNRKIKPLTTARNILGITLMLPTASGYCAIQIMLFKIIIVSVGMANGVWRAALDYNEAMGGMTFASADSQMYRDMDKLIPNMKKIYCAALQAEHSYYTDRNKDPLNTVRAEYGAHGQVTVADDERMRYEVSIGKGTPPLVKDLQSSDEYLALMQAALTAVTTAATQSSFLAYSRDEIKPEHGLYQESCRQSVPADMCWPARILVNMASTYYSMVRVERLNTSAPGLSDMASKHGWVLAGSYFHKLMSANAQDPFRQHTMANVTLSPLVIPMLNDANCHPANIDGHDGGISVHFSALADMSQIEEKAKEIIADMESASKPLKSSQDTPDIEDQNQMGTIMGIVFNIIPSGSLIQDLFNASDSSFDNPTSLPGVDVMLGLKNIYRMLAQTASAFTGLYVLKKDHQEYHDKVEDGRDLDGNTSCIEKLSQEGCKADRDISTQTKECANALFDKAASSCLLDDYVGLINMVRRDYEISQYQSTDGHVLTPANPYVNLIQMGDGLIDAATGYWYAMHQNTTRALVDTMWWFWSFRVMITALWMGAGALATGPLSAAGGAALGATHAALWQVISSFQQRIVYLITLTTDFGNAIAMVIFSLGNFLAYYLPFIPVIVYTLAVIGWYMLLVEAIIAAPLVALGLTHPQYHDYLGQAQQAVMLYVLVMVRAPVIVISLFLAINLIYIAFDYMNYMFLGVLWQFIPFGESANQNLMLTVGIFLVYTYFAFAIIVTVLEIIHDLPDRIARWIGGAMLNPGGNIQQMLSEIRGGFGAAAQAAGHGGSHFAKGADGFSSLASSATPFSASQSKETGMSIGRSLATLAKGGPPKSGTKDGKDEDEDKDKDKEKKDKDQQDEQRQGREEVRRAGFDDDADERDRDSDANDSDDDGSDGPEGGGELDSISDLDRRETLRSRPVDADQAKAMKEVEHIIAIMPELPFSDVNQKGRDASSEVQIRQDIIAKLLEGGSVKDLLDAGYTDNEIEGACQAIKSDPSLKTQWDTKVSPAKQDQITQEIRGLKDMRMLQGRQFLEALDQLDTEDLFNLVLSGKYSDSQLQRAYLVYKDQGDTGQFDELGAKLLAVRSKVVDWEAQHGPIKLGWFTQADEQHLFDRSMGGQPQVEIGGDASDTVTDFDALPMMPDLRLRIADEEATDRQEIVERLKNGAKPEDLLNEGYMLSHINDAHRSAYSEINNSNSYRWLLVSLAQKTYPKAKAFFDSLNKQDSMTIARGIAQGRYGAEELLNAYLDFAHIFPPRTKAQLAAKFGRFDREDNMVEQGEIDRALKALGYEDGLATKGLLTKKSDDVYGLDQLFKPADEPSLQRNYGGLQGEEELRDQRANVLADLLQVSKSSDHQGDIKGKTADEIRVGQDKAEAMNKYREEGSLLKTFFEDLTLQKSKMQGPSQASGTVTADENMQLDRLFSQANDKLTSMVHQTTQLNEQKVDLIFDFHKALGTERYQQKMGDASVPADREQLEATLRSEIRQAQEKARAIIADNNVEHFKALEQPRIDNNDQDQLLKLAHLMLRDYQLTNQEESDRLAREGRQQDVAEYQDVQKRATEIRSQLQAGMDLQALQDKGYRTQDIMQAVGINTADMLLGTDIQPAELQKMGFTLPDLLVNYFLIKDSMPTAKRRPFEAQLLDLVKRSQKR